MATVSEEDKKPIGYPQIMEADTTFTYSAPLVIQPAHSRLLLGGLVFSHLFSIFVTLLFAHSNIYLSLFLIACISISFIYYYRQLVIKQGKKSVFEVVHHKNNGWKISLKGSDEDKPVTLDNSSYSGSWMIILNFIHEAEGRFVIIIPYDSVHESVYRQLRVRLKIFHKDDQ